MSISARSLDQIDNESYHAGPAPFDAPAVTVPLAPGRHTHPSGKVQLCLDGEWQMACDGDELARLSGDWTDAIPAQIPGSVHTALWKAGQIPDPYLGLNDAIARGMCFKTWWFKRTFSRPANTTGEKITFDGIAVHGTVWLNGIKLGEHEGMFGGPEFTVDSLLQDTNTLIVRIDPAPFEAGPGPLNDFFKGKNVGWARTVVFNNVYGWHYSNIPSLGIWRSVRLDGAPAVAIEHPFIAARDAKAGLVDLALKLRGPQGGWSGKLIGSLEPGNFTGEAHRFEMQVNAGAETKDLHLSLTVPNPRLWWPNGYGEQNLYRVVLSFIPVGGGIPDTCELPLGIRTIRMAPLPGGPYPDKFNWTFVINDRPLFIKGTGWCTMDPLMDFSPERYARLLDLARDQHIMMLRAWGSGMPETDEFYDQCDRLGILVFQEWPTAWNSHETEPYEILEETVRLNTLRLRNHPSLALWGGGNESDKPFGRAIDMMGRLSIELDGTRVFHRGEPWGGSLHDYTSDWGRKPLDHNLHLRADFFGEFGMNSVPVVESVMRYLPDEEKKFWPPPDTGAFFHHTPVFNTRDCMERLRQFSGYFSEGKTMPDFIFGSQLAASTCTRHTLELARTRWPSCSGALYYKMNDNYPAASWACVDWYGAPKMTHFFNMDAFAPLAAPVLFDSLENDNRPLDLDCWLLDDQDVLKDQAWQVRIRIYHSDLHRAAEKTFSGSGSIGSVRQLGVFALTSAQTHSTPLLITSEVVCQGQLAFRTFYWLNYEKEKDCLQHLPAATLQLKSSGANQVEVSNSSLLPAVGVHVEQPGKAHLFQVDDNYFWLEPGETKVLHASSTEGLVVKAWNVA